MGRNKRMHIKLTQRVKRRKSRQELSKKGKNPDEYFYSGFYIGKPLG